MVDSRNSEKVKYIDLVDRTYARPFIENLKFKKRDLTLKSCSVIIVHLFEGFFNIIDDRCAIFLI